MAAKRQLGVALDPDLRAKLDAACAKSGESIAAEIRTRLEASFFEEQFDEPTQRLLASVKRLAGQVAARVGLAWHQHPIAHEAFATALAARLAELKPPLPTGAVVDLFFLKPEDDPATIGRLIERDDAAIEKHFRTLPKATKGK